MHDAVLHEAAEHEGGAAWRPDDAAGDGEVGGEQQDDARAGRDRDAGERKPRDEMRAQQVRGHAETQHQGDDGKRGVVAGRAERDQRDQQPAFRTRELLGAEGQKIKCEHREPGKGVRHQLAGKPGQAGRGGEQRKERGQENGAIAEPVHAQAQGDDPGGNERLNEHDRPEIGPAPGAEEEAIDGGPAGRERVEEGAAEIGAGVIEQQRKAVPDRRQQ